MAVLTRSAILTALFNFSKGLETGGIRHKGNPICLVNMSRKKAELEMYEFWGDRRARVMTITRVAAACLNAMSTPC